MRDVAKAAERQRRYRARQRAKRNVFAVEIDFDMIDAMIENGLLEAAKSDDAAAVNAAILGVLTLWKNSVTRNASSRL